MCLWARVPDELRHVFVQMAGAPLPYDPHVTILFWPEVADDFEAAVIAASLDLALRVLPATTATVTGLGQFKKGVNVALISMPEIERYRAVARVVDDPDPASPFGIVPHVTLQTAETAADLPMLAAQEYDGVSWPVTELEVMRAERVLRTISLVQ